MNETPQQAARRFSQHMLDKDFNPTGLHNYTDSEGHTIYWRIRLKHPNGKKWIRPMHVNGNGYELAEPKFPGKKPIYSLDRIASDPDALVWIVEGEQKADALNNLGLVATTSGGVTSAGAADWEPLRGRTARIWPDNDDAGKTYAGEVANILLGMGCAVTCADVDHLGLGKREDFVDWLVAHPNATCDDIEALPTIAARRKEKGAFSQIVVLDIAALLTHDFPPMEELLSPWLCKQHLSMVHAWRGVGKTHFALGVAYAVAGGGQYLKWKADKPRRVVYIDGEMAGAAIKTRIAGMVESSPDESEPPEGYFRIVTPDAQPMPLPDLSTVEGQEALAPCIADAELIVVDNLSCLMRSGTENDSESWVPVAEWALELRRQGKAVLFVQHDGKGGQQRGTSKKEDIMDVVIQLEHTKDYDPQKGAAFVVKFRKARELKGKDAQDLEAVLSQDEHGKQAWAWKDAELGMAERILAMHADAPGLTQSEIAEELGCNRSTVSRALKAASKHGTGGLQ